MALLFAAVGLALVFFVPGYFVVRATFPEWRLRGPEALLRWIEIGTLGFVVSVTLTLLVGYGLLVGSPAGFQASATDPVLEAILVGIALAAAAVAWRRGAFRHEGINVPRARRVVEPLDPRVLREQLDRLGWERRRIERDLHMSSPSDPQQERLREELERVRAALGEIQHRREAEYAE